MSWRSRQWLNEDGATGIIHRVGFAQCGFDVGELEGKPIIAILESWSDLTPCNATVPEVAKHVAEGIALAGGQAVRIPIPGLGEQFIRPTSMLYRGMLSMLIEELLAANPIDGVVSLSACDKTTAGALLGVVSADIPTICLTTGPMSGGGATGRQVASGTDIWRMLEEGNATSESVEEMAVGPGHCNTMGTASTMAIAIEVLGLGLPGASTTEAQSPKWAQIGREAGRAAVQAVHHEKRPSGFVTEAALKNAFTAVAACAGSTNAVLHLLALAGRMGIELKLLDLQALFRQVPVVVNVSPSGQFLLSDFHAVGGVPALLRGIRELLDGSCENVLGDRVSMVVDSAPAPDGIVIRSLDDSVTQAPGLAVVSGNLAPDGALVKQAAASETLHVHSGPALVFESLDTYLQRYRRDDLPLTAETVIVVRNCGPVGYPGMPEVANVPIPPSLLRRGVRDVVRISDGRMSGTSYGTVVLHVAPEAAVGGPLGRLQTGDLIRLDLSRGELEAEADLAKRPPPPRAPVTSGGYVDLFRDSVLQADSGCDLNFLRGVRQRASVPARLSL